MSKFQVAYVPIGVPTFHLESAQKEFDKSIELISSITNDGAYPKEMLLSIEDLNAYLDTVTPELLILQTVTFANSAYACEVLKRFSCPVLLWTLREPVIDGGRLRLNSLTGAYSAGNAMMAFGRESFEYVFSAPGEEQAKQRISAAIHAAELRHSLKNLKIASIGHTPQGFGFGRALDTDLLKVFGVTMDSIEARALMKQAEAYTDEECRGYLDSLGEHTAGLATVPEVNQKNFARLLKSYTDYAEENHIGALASRCWPDFFIEYGTPVCAVLSMLNDAGIAAACESDVYGALSMYMGMRLSGQPVFFGDPVSLDEAESSITFWHCGTAACSLANRETGAQLGVHPNRKIGPTMEFGCRPAKNATAFRVGQKADGRFRFFLLSGEVLDKPKQFSGTSIVVKTGRPSREIVEESVKDGWEPHFAVIYGDVLEELKILGHMLDIEVLNYT